MYEKSLFRQKTISITEHLGECNIQSLTDVINSLPIIYMCSGPAHLCRTIDTLSERAGETVVPDALGASFGVFPSLPALSSSSNIYPPSILLIHQGL